MTRPIIAIAVNAGLRGEVGDFPFEVLPEVGEAASAISGLPPLSAWFRGKFVGFPFEALLMLVLGFAVRTKAVFAISGLLPLRLALNVAVDRRLDFVLLAFLAMGSPVEGCVVKSCPPKKEAMRAQRCALALADREEEDRSDARTREPLWGCVQRRLVGERQGVRKVPSLIDHAAISCATTRPN
jgi:hypothetical protein